VILLVVCRENGERFKKVMDLALNDSPVDAEGNTPLHIAAQKNFFLIVETLLDAGANISAVNHSVRSPIFSSCLLFLPLSLINFSWYLPVLIMTQGHTALHVASFANAIESATLLIARGASIVAQVCFFNFLIFLIFKIIKLLFRMKMGVLLCTMRV
jgi:ankyrin repeat protein